MPNRWRNTALSPLLLLLLPLLPAQSAAFSCPSTSVLKLGAIRVRLYASAQLGKGFRAPSTGRKASARTSCTRLSYSSRVRTLASMSLKVREVRRVCTCKIRMWKPNQCCFWHTTTFLQSPADKALEDWADCIGIERAVEIAEGAFGRGGSVRSCTVDSIQ